MEVISIDGVNYIKASAIAKQFRYTADYVGQLCRGRKVDARLVGRTWYVNPLSLEGHKIQKTEKPARNKPSRLDDKQFIYNVEINKSRREVPAVIKRSTAKSLATFSPRHNYESRIEWKPARYESDDTDLLPALVPTQDPVHLTLSPAEASNLAVKGESKAARLIPTELPEIALKGELTVSSLDEDFSEHIGLEEEPFLSEGLSDIASINNDFLVSTAPVEPLHDQAKIKRVRRREMPQSNPGDSIDPVYKVPLKLNQTTSRMASSSKVEAEKSFDSEKTNYELPSFTPARVRARAATQNLDDLRIEGVVSSTVSWQKRSLFILLGLSLIFAALTYSLELVESVSQDGAKTDYRFAPGR